MVQRNAAVTKAVTKAVTQALAGDGPLPDRRRERSRNSREKIIRAMMELIAKGHIDPSATKVAETAGVGRRSVFRHFEDKDAIYREMNQILSEAFLPKLRAPYLSDDWKEQLFELVERRAEVNEQIAPFRISTSVQRFNSPVLMDNYRQILRGERKALNAILPDDIKRDEQRSRAILLAVSFDSWRLFRQDEDLSKQKTLEAIRQLLQDILSQTDDRGTAGNVQPVVRR